MNINNNNDINMNEEEMVQNENGDFNGEEEIQEQEFNERTSNQAYSQYQVHEESYYNNNQYEQQYNIDNTEPIQFLVEVFDIEHFEYVYNIKKDRYSKTKLLHEGFGAECPDREMHVKLKIQIKINGVIFP